MPRPFKPARLFIDKQRNAWVIRDRHRYVRTGCAADDVAGAQAKLREYLARTHQPAKDSTPKLADVLLLYVRERLSETVARKQNYSFARFLALWWGDKRTNDVTPAICKEYAMSRPRVAALKELEMLRAAIHHWHKSTNGPLSAMPVMWFPPKPEGRERWLTRSEVARLLWAARRSPHLSRFIIVAYYTGTRSGAVLALQWSWIDLRGGVMRRRAPGEAELATKRRPPVRLGDRLLSHLRRWRRLDHGIIKHVVHGSGGKGLVSMDRPWHAARKRAGLGDECTAHILRHSRATVMMQAGIDPWEAAGFLGMSIQTLTRTYGHHHPAFQRRAANAR